TVIDQGRMKQQAELPVYPTVTFPFSCFLHQSCNNLLSGGSSGVYGPFTRLSAKRPAGKVAVCLPCKYYTNAFQPLNNFGSVLTKRCNRLVACNSAAAFYCFFYMKLHTILCITFWQYGVYPPCRHNRLCAF